MTRNSTLISCARRVAGGLVLLGIATPLAVAAPPFSISNVPLFLAPNVKPNLMVILDNSQSMDATMAGAVIAGDDPNTRGNTARRVLRNILNGPLGGSFNWGLTTFDLNLSGGEATRFNTQAYWLGNASTMVYTNTCTAGLSNVVDPRGPSGTFLRCIPNPETGNGYNFITYEVAGDDPAVNDVIYTGNNNPFRYILAQSGNYFWWANHNNGATSTTWSTADFTGGPNAFTLSPTDTGFGPQPSSYSRVFLKPRAWGFLNDIRGGGDVVNPVRDLGTSGHLSSLLESLANETGDPDDDEIKNAALFTPIAGSLETVKDYFRQGQSASRPSPISQTCQANFVVLATDGNPTAKKNGGQYSAAEMLPNGAGWNQAQVDVFSEISGLRRPNFTVSNSGSAYLSNPALAGQSVDIQTYVIGMGDSVANPTSIAALNEMARLGGGNSTAFLGNSEATLTSAFEAIVGDIQAKTSTASSAAVNAGSWNAGSRVFQAKFNSSGWSGDLLAYSISSTGVINPTAIWSTATQIQGQNWNTGRNIIGYKPSAALGSRGVPFRWPANPASPAATELDAAQTDDINKDPGSGTADGHGALRLAFLRGDASRELRNCATCSAPRFRNRPAGPLGDIVHSAPYFVAGPAFGYADDFEIITAPYSAFAATYRTRTPVIYVGANDGMLHAINATSGAELFAYVPSFVYPNLGKLSASPYTHRPYVDGSPTVGDVFYGGAWHTLLVSGMRAGAKGLFALDVTNPSNFTEANAASVVRWEYQDADLGFVYGQPLLVKTNNGRWSVIVSGGYNAGNADGRAKLFIIDAETGSLTMKIDTGAGTAASPNGLSAPAAIDTNGDGVVDVVYAGDLDGNLWKFNLSSATASSWALGNGGVALFVASSGQAITSAPDVTRFPAGGYLIGFGTGRYLASTDNASTGAQALYAIWDNLSSGTVPLSNLQQQSILGTTTQSGVTFRLSSYAVGIPGDTLISTKDHLIERAAYLSGKRGWYLDLPTSGERVVTDAAFRAGRLIFTSMIPDASTPCAAGGSGWLLEFDAVTGNRLGTPTFDVNNDNALTSADFLAFTAAGTGSSNNVTGRSIQGIPAAPAFMSSGKLDFRLIPNSDATLESIRGGLGVGRDGRAMWREVR